MLGLQFLQKGIYQGTEYQHDEAEDIEDLNNMLAEHEPKEVRLHRKRNRINLQFNRDVPDVEWWDSFILGSKNYLDFCEPRAEASEQAVFQFNLQELIKAIPWAQLHQEPQYQRVGSLQDESRVVMPMFLTKQERKQLKRKAKHQKLLEKNDQIKLGLIQPDKPKLRVGNMAIVLKNEFILDPSLV